MEMSVCLPYDELQDMVQISDGGISADKEPTQIRGLMPRKVTLS